MRFRFWNRQVPTEPPLAQTQSRGREVEPERTRKTAAPEQPATDTDGTLRRLRQTVEDYRLL